VVYFPAKYGAEIVAVALDILHRRAVPPAVFVKHQLVTPDTVNHIYPNDELMITNGLSA
jgi:ribose transport system substrate-binding protein